jgi:hypothetical protein
MRRRNEDDVDWLSRVDTHVDVVSVVSMW